MEKAEVAILDIEGTICSISFVKDELYPYFMQRYQRILDDLEYPLKKVEGNSEIDSINNIVADFPDVSNKQAIVDTIEYLVSKDIKDPVLKAFQGFVWKLGYENGDIVAPIYPDAIKFIKSFSSSKKVYIYSSGSVKAQLLLFKYVSYGDNVIDLNPYISGNFDITTSGFKTDSSSYVNILKSIGFDGNADKVSFFSDNVKEVEAATEAGMKAFIVDRPGNNPLSADDIKQYELIETFDALRYSI